MNKWLSNFAGIKTGPLIPLNLNYPKRPKTSIETAKQRNFQLSREIGYKLANNIAPQCATEFLAGVSLLFPRLRRHKTALQRQYSASHHITSAI